MRESKIEAYLNKQVRAIGGQTRKVRFIDRRGAPDRLIMLPHCVRVPPQSRCANLIWVELKATGKEAEAHQVREHARMRKLGQVVVVIDSLDGVDRLLAGEGA
jgi:hypothetical protein